MKSPLKSGQVLDSGFEIVEVVELTELEAAGIWARHVKSGAEVFHVLNDDEENLFAFAFTTAPEDSTGVAHVLEHSVLCGSERYPLKDAFLVLAQGSLQTFLNAWTFPDKTVYPASSVNERDYFNLMGVYGDAVFRPLLSEWTFMQEAHRLLFVPNDVTANGAVSKKAALNGEKLSVTGVVYNEMKGAYSSLDTYAGNWSVSSVLPDTPYAFDSGGDPEEISRLTLDGLRAFHRKKYAPANCRIFLAGNIPTEKQLAFLNGQFLAALPTGTPAAPVPKAAPWTAPKTMTVPCPAGGERKSTVFLSWLCSDGLDNAEALALGALAEILLGHDGSPLTRLLIESGLGEDLSPVSGLESELRETVFTVGLRGVGDLPGADPSGGRDRKIEALVLGELERLVREGIPREEIDAALLSMEFANREIRRAGGAPYSLVWMRRSLRSWIHGGRPWDSLLFVPGFSELKRRLSEDKRYMESLIRRYLLDNPHRALVSVVPEDDFLKIREAALERSLAEQAAALSLEGRRDIKEKAVALEQFQSEKDSPAALAKIPHLSRKDLDPVPEYVHRDIRDLRGAPVLVHELFTNGISYGDFAFPLDILDPADYPWLPLFSRSVVSLGLPGMDYGEVSSLLARTAGGFYAALQTGTAAGGAAAATAVPGGILDLVGRDWIVFRLKALDEKFGAALDLALRLITEADFTDRRRVRDLVMEMKSDADSSIAPSGHSYAAARSGRFFSRSRRVDELWNGVTQLEFIHTAAALDVAEICGTLSRIRDAIVNRGGFAGSITASAGAVDKALREAAGRFTFGPPGPRHPCRETGAFTETGERRPEVLASPSLQVGFAALSLRGSSYADRRIGAEAVLAHRLSTGALWEDIRMKGGAYGAFANSDALEECFGFATYRDPDPLRSLDAFPAILRKETEIRCDDESLEKTVIGSFAKEKRPRTSAEKGYGDFLRFLYGIEDRRREQRLRAVVEVRAEEIAAAAARLAAVASEDGPGMPVVLAGLPMAEQAAAKLGATVRTLPA
jgi:Zn-dependent M16 (insulinase) family peptidase